MNAGEWLYEGNQLSSGLLTSECVLYIDLIKLITRRLGMEENTILKLSYSPIVVKGIPPIYVLCDEDLRAYMFTNSQRQVFQTPLYCEVIPKEEEIEIPFSAPVLDSQTNSMAGDTKVNDRKRKRQNKTIPT